MSETRIKKKFDHTKIRINQREHVIRFIVNGIPRPKQSFRYSKTGGYTLAEITAWENKVATEAERAINNRDLISECEYMAHPLSVELDFYLPDRRRRDLDNLSKAVLDAMNGIVYKDDAQIIDLHLRKFFDSPEYGVTVVVALTRKGEE